MSGTTLSTHHAAEDESGGDRDAQRFQRVGGNIVAGIVHQFLLRGVQVMSLLSESSSGRRSDISDLVHSLMRHGRDLG